MTADLTHDEIQSLLGAYALDAVDRAEADAIDVHLRSCPRCRAEVAEHREVAALLGHAGADAPAGVWDRIAGALEEQAPAPGPALSSVVVPLDAARRRSSGPSSSAGRALRVASIGAAAVAAAVIALLGVRVVDQGNQLDQLTAALSRGGVAQAALAAEGDPDARTVELRDADGSVVAAAVLLPDGAGYLLRNRFAPLGADRTYQLWAVVDDRVISAGVLGSDPDVVAFRAPAGAAALAVTAEIAGGVVRSEQTPVASGEVDTA